MMTGWSCPKCTYLHDTPQERNYLSCAICSEPKPNNCIPNAASTAHHDKRQKRQGILLHHFGGAASSVKRQCTEQRPHSTSATSSTTPNNNAGRTRSILDALKPRPASSFVPRARYRNNSKEAWRELDNDKDLSKLFPLTLVRDVLPPTTAAKLLDQLEQESVSWKRQNWIIHGKEHLIPRTVATYNFLNDATLNPLYNGGSEYSNADQDIGGVGDIIIVPIDESDEYQDQKRSISPELRQAANCVTEIVKRHCPWAKEEEEDWEPTFALANRYANGQECVGWHSDHIMKLGPRPIIVGLSLGACRRFELRQQTSGNKGKPACRHVSVPLPHNSLCIMWNDAQESWQHSVPRCSDDAISKHPKVGPTRISLTFRKLRQIPDLGNCHCGRPAGLKAKEGKYYLFCIPYGDDKRQTCNFWKSCRWAENEALRLAHLERCAANRSSSGSS